jgi:hypothetical protein
MCPVCFGSMAWLITGGVSALGATAGGAVIVRYRKDAAIKSKAWKLRLASRFGQVLCLDDPKTLAVQKRIGTGETHG